MFHRPISIDRTVMPVPADSLEGRDAAVAALRRDAVRRARPRIACLAFACLLVVLYGAGGRMGVGTALFWSMLVATSGTAMLAPRAMRAGGVFRIPVALEWALHAAPWALLPLLTGTGRPAATDAVLGAALCTMMAGAVPVAAVAGAARAWVAVLTLGLVLLMAGRGAPSAGLLVLLPLYSAAILIGCRSVRRMLVAQFVTIHDERAAHESIALLLKEYEDQGVGWLWQTDAQDRLNYVSPRICVMLDRPTGQLIGRSLSSVLGDDPGLDDRIRGRAAFTDLAFDVATPGGMRCVLLAGSPVIDLTGGYHGFRGVGTDITETRRSQDRLRQLASIDMLTGLPNRQRLRQLFGEALDRTRRTGTACAILFLDLDGFKAVNDGFGHMVGDAVLRIVAQRLRAQVGAMGLLGRIGGDEFALLLHDAGDPAAVEALARRLIATIAEPFLFDRGEIRIGISIGCAFAPDDGHAVDDLLTKADLALYEAKARGRGTVCLFDAHIRRDAEARSALERDLHRALERGQLRLDYQPVLAAESGRVLGFEALLRWDHPELGPVPPRDIVPLAEDSGLIQRIGDWVLAQACRDAAGWPGEPFVAVNLSPRQLSATLPAHVAAALAGAGLAPARLELEVTERIFGRGGDAALAVLRQLCALGVGVALDDFGTGASALGHVDPTVFRTLKLDGRLVRATSDAPDAPDPRAVVGAIVTLADGFGMQVVAKGIETADELGRARDAGCHRAQGFLLGRPMPHAATHALVGGDRCRREPA